MNLYAKYIESALPSFLYGIMHLVAILLWIVFAILTLPLYLLFRLFKSLQGAFISYHRLGNVLASKDVPFLHETETNRYFISGLFVIKGPYDIDEYRQLLVNCIFKTAREEPSYKRMHKRVVERYGHYVWIDENDFDIKKHVFVYDGPRPSSEEELQESMCELFSSHIDDDVSPWQFIVIPINSGVEKHALYVRIHHAIGDGFAMIGLIAKIVDRKPELLRVKKPVKTPCDKQKTVWKTMFTGPLALLSVALSSANNPFPSVDQLSGKKCFSWTPAINLEFIKDIKVRTGTTVNDVLAACLAGALRCYLKEEGSKDPDDIQIAISINTRSPAVLSQNSIPLENHSTGMLFSLPVGKDDPQTRLIETKRRMDSLKTSTDWLLFGWTYSHIIGNLPDFIARFASYSLNRHCALILSNVPGPLNELEIINNKVETVIPWPPLISNTSMCVSVFSYAGSVRVAVLTDEAVLSQPRRLTDRFVQEFKQMYEGVVFKPLESSFIQKCDIYS